VEEGSSPHDEGFRSFLQEEELREANRRRFLYADVETLISDGFLVHSLDIFGVTLTFRSLPTNAWKRLEARKTSRLEEHLSWYIAESIHMVDGLLVSEDANASYVLFKEWVSKLPLSLVRELCSIPNGLARRVERAISMTEAYSYEPYGRSLLHMSENSPENLVKIIWRTQIEAEEVRDRDYITWNHTVTIASSFAGSKATQSITAALEKERKKEKDRRGKVIEKMVNGVIGNRELSEPVVVVEFDGKRFEVPRFMSASTEADLFGEMDRVMKNSQDYHDEVVRRYKEGIRERIEAERLERRKAVEKAAQLAQEEQSSDRPSLIAYTQEQLSELRPDMNFDRPKIVDSSNAGRLFDRYLAQETKVGWIGAGGTPEPANLNSEEAQPIQEALEARKPVLR